MTINYKKIVYVIIFTSFFQMAPSFSMDTEDLEAIKFPKNIHKLRPLAYELFRKCNPQRNKMPEGEELEKILAAARIEIPAINKAYFGTEETEQAISDLILLLSTNGEDLAERIKIRVEQG